MAADESGAAHDEKAGIFHKFALPVQRAAATVCQPNEEPTIFSAKSGRKTLITTRAKPLDAAVDPLRTSVIKRLPRRMTAIRYRLKKGKPAVVAISTVKPLFSSSVRSIGGVKCWRCPICRSNSDCGPPGTVTTKVQPGAR